MTLASDLKTRLANAMAAYDDGACYFETGDVAKAKSFVTACIRLQTLLAEVSRQGGRFEMGFGRNLQNIAAELANARRFVANQAGGGDIGYSLNNFRG